MKNTADETIKDTGKLPSSIGIALELELILAKQQRFLDQANAELATTNGYFS